MRSKGLSFTVICAASLLALCGCGKEGSNPGPKGSQHPSGVALPDGWEWYADSAIKFAHPKDRKVVPLPGDPMGYFVMEQGDIDGMPGAESISIAPKSSPNPVGLSLREIVLARLKDAAREDTRLLGSLQNIILPGGRCVYCVTEGFTIGGCSTPTGNKPACFGLALVSECEAWQKNIPVKIVTTTEAYPDAGKPSPRAREQVQVYERLVKSIEFKK